MMTIYQYRASVSTSSGSTSSTTLKIRGGILRHFLVRAATSSTVFRSNLVDESNLQMLNYGFQTGELNDINIAIPVCGQYSVNITNASPDDSFNVYLAVEE